MIEMNLLYLIVNKKHKNFYKKLFDIRCRITVIFIGRPVLPITHTLSHAGGAGAPPLQFVAFSDIFIHMV